MQSPLSRRLFLAGLLLLPGLAARPAAAQEATTGGLRLQVTELALSVDLSRGKERFLTVTVELSGRDGNHLRRVQPLREDFQLLAAGKPLPCRWLRGGSVPDDPNRLRFTLGFSMPPPRVKQVDLRANLPRLGADETLDLRLDDLRPGQLRKGPGWSLTVREFEERAYQAPALPPKGSYTSKLGPVDARVYRKADPKSGEPERALLLSFWSETEELYDATIDVSGHLLVDGRPGPTLLSAKLLREPSRTVKAPPVGPFVRAEFYFPALPKLRPSGALIRLHRRPASTGKPVVIRKLPVPGRG